jgi:hypothetical protein
MQNGTLADSARVLGPKLAARVLPKLVSRSEREVLLASVSLFTSAAAAHSAVRRTSPHAQFASTRSRIRRACINSSLATTCSIRVASWRASAGTRAVDQTERAHAPRRHPLLRDVPPPSEHRAWHHALRHRLHDGGGALKDDSAPAQVVAVPPRSLRRLEGRLPAPHMTGWL